MRVETLSLCNMNMIHKLIIDKLMAINKCHSYFGDNDFFIVDEPPWQSLLTLAQWCGCEDCLNAALITVPQSMTVTFTFTYIQQTQTSSPRDCALTTYAVLK